jgi:hypothetical protein
VIDNLKSKIPDPKSQILLLAGGVILLGIVAWGIGWGAHALLDHPAAQPSSTPMGTAAIQPAATSVPTARVLMTPSSSDLNNPPSPTAPLPPTYTPAPSPTLPSTPAPVEQEEWATVQAGEGLYMVCRRHCPARWPPDDADLEEYARSVGALNDLTWPDPALTPGDLLRMPPCP